MTAQRSNAGLRVWPWTVGLAASAVFFLAAWLRYTSFHSTAYDLAFFDQVVWNAARGQGLSSSFLPYSFFGQHFEPALLLFVPLYWLVPSPLWLLLGQSIALGLAVVPLYVLATRALGQRAAWIAVAAYLLQLAVSRTIEFDFHTEALAVPFVLMALVAAGNGRWRLFLILGTVPLLCKEDGGLLTLALGLLVFVWTRQRSALLLSVAAITLDAVIVLAIMPAYRHGAPGDLILRYAYLGSSPSAVALHFFTQPATVLRHLIASGSGPALLLSVLGVGALPLRRPLLLLIAAIPMLPSLLSSNAVQTQLHLHYGVPGIPLLMAVAILAWERLASMRHGMVTAGGSLLAGAIVTFLVFSPLPRALAVDWHDLSRSGEVNATLRQIPASAAVAASTSLTPHLSERATIDELPCGIGSDEWLAVDQIGRPSDQSRAAGLERAVTTLEHGGYATLATGGGVTIWRRPVAAGRPASSCFPGR